MYKHYQDVGEPLSIRKFLKRMLSATVKYSRFKNLKLDDAMHYNGKNTVNFGTRIEYKPGNVFFFLIIYYNTICVFNARNTQGEVSLSHRNILICFIRLAHLS